MPPTLRAFEKKPPFRGLMWIGLVFGGLSLVGGLTTPGESPVRVSSLVLSALMMAPGLWHLIIKPRRAARARAAITNDPERQARLARWQSGEGVDLLDEMPLEMPCSYYRRAADGSLEARDAGELSLSSKLLRLSGAANSREFRLSQLRGVTVKRDGVEIAQANGPHWVVAVADPEEFGLALAAAIASATGASIRVDRRS